MIITDKYIIFEGYQNTVYYFNNINKLPQTKENTLLKYIAMIAISWTFKRMTDEEKTECINTMIHATECEEVFGTYQQRWKIYNAIYSAFLAALGYRKNPINWREEETA